MNESGNVDDYMYCLFAYIVSDESDYPSDVGTRINLATTPTIESSTGDDLVQGEGSHTMKGRKVTCPTRYIDETYDGAI